eukprot:gnl/TRDRNA2_/TRDRNA2_163801_c0_seq3.p1 gnl/TRDRNA2_/TRDRNA2_163801_c0~~gnl/TRDRNA2_/TRDRNA2_163801_c0_seq3.p1  ORF type:complete len:371 (+),score=52.92 gnl/TRDRNA2_/TRDRNA2_163801_c0_seq3:23-1135(+)
MLLLVVSASYTAKAFAAADRTLECAPGAGLIVGSSGPGGASSRRGWWLHHLQDMLPQAILLNCGDGAAGHILENSAPTQLKLWTRLVDHDGLQNDRLHTYNPVIQRLEPGLHLAVFRRSNHNNCHRHWQAVPSQKEEQIGISLLDGNMKPLVEWSDVLDDAASFPWASFAEQLPELRAAGLQELAGIYRTLEDCRIATIRRVAGIAGRWTLVMSCSAMVFPTYRADKSIWPQHQGMLTVLVAATVAFGIGSISSSFVDIRKPFVAVKFPSSFPGSAKNVNYFRGHSRGRLFAEFSLEPHLVCEVDLATGHCVDTGIAATERLARSTPPALQASLQWRLGTKPWSSRWTTAPFFVVAAAASPRNGPAGVCS